ncbi:opine metallophore biosynthesis dehydrogenase [Planococcus sp. ISL-109]|uniref:opine metallophore biosynthesis dehydrogenase n=1 Tax=Planococcus sp. ISL-109 TaxID=2819166 RepID=UPI001BE97002|nr:opine metallophore biosynthesis dehydrogenase [Planococcus sp. ISL-109]MBT2583220.1 opine metallophore biosynthesis dehydrogenase [Planococcus sp. ISL-109]
MKGKKENMPVNTTFKNPFGNTLLVGAGPAAINIAVHVSMGWCDKLGLVNRAGTHTNRLKESFKKNGTVLKARNQSQLNQDLSGEAKLDFFYGDFQEIDDKWDTLIICTPSDTYIEVIKSLCIRKLKRIKTLVLISPGIGSNFLIERVFKMELRDIDIISFSAYYAATKYEADERDDLTVLTKAFKKRIYLASSKEKSTKLKVVREFIESLGVQCGIVSSPIEAESKNITTYVHPALFLDSFAMEQVLRKDLSLKSMYKIYPEGPITQHKIRIMVRLWKEISHVVEHFGAKPINLLKFLNDDNYPVHEKTLSREDIEQFQTFNEEKQAFLLYIRYSAILIDPFSSPDERGRYFEFSAVPFKPVSAAKSGRWLIPRIPLEDYQKLKVLYELAQLVNIQMPQALLLLQTFEREVSRFSIENNISFSNYTPRTNGEAFNLDDRLIDSRENR